MHERVAEVKPRAGGEALSEAAPYWTVMRSAGRVPGAGLLVAGRQPAPAESAAPAHHRQTIPAPRQGRGRQGGHR